MRALAHIARETLNRADDVRSFVRGLLQTTVNLRPDVERGELRVQLHAQANPVHAAAVAALCIELNETETHHPGTKLRLRYIPLRDTPVVLNNTTDPISPADSNLSP